MRIADFVVVLGDKVVGVLSEHQEKVPGTLIHSVPAKFKVASPEKPNIK